MQPAERRVSVLTPSLGYGDFIRDALLSVQGQQRVRPEHIVQDGRSTDATIDVLREFGERVRWRSEDDAGQSDALNKALAQASNEWVGTLNADEFYLPDALSVLADEGERTGADVVYGDVVFVDEHGRLLRLLAAHTFDRRALRRYGCFIETCATLYRRSALPESPWDVGMKRIMDWDAFLRLDGQDRRFRYVPYPVGAFRVHDRQVTARPGEDFPTEYAALRERHRAGGGRRTVGRAVHRGRKVLEGSFRRELRARPLAGADFRWFRPEVGMQACRALLDRCYGEAADVGGGHVAG